MLRKWLIALVCLFTPVVVRAQTATVSGNIRDVGVANITGSNTFIRFTLRNYNGIPVVTGTNVIARAQVDFHPDGSGNISGTIQENNSITASGVTGNTFYNVCAYYQGVQLQCNQYVINSNFNLSTATPMVLPPQPAFPPTALIGTTANLPASCTIGQVYFATDALAGANFYLCTSANTWTQVKVGIKSGTCVFAGSSTCSISYGTYYASTPVVVITPVNPSSTTFTLTSSSNSGFTITASGNNSITVNYLAIGNPN